MVVGVGAIVLAVTLPEESRSTGEGGPLSLSPWLLVPIIVYEVAVLATFALGRRRGRKLATIVEIRRV